MINGLGVLGWGVGGIEAEAAMLGESISMLVPQVVGFKLTGELREGATATDLVLTVTQILRRTGVVGKFVEYFGHGLRGLSLADRATIGNMSPEYGATCGFFPVDEVTLEYLRLTARPDERVALVEAYCKENMLWHEPDERADVLPGRRARPRRRGAEPRRAAAPAGSRAARRREAVVPHGAVELRRRVRERGTTRGWRRRSPPATRPPSSSPAHDDDGEAELDGHQLPPRSSSPSGRRQSRCELDGERFELEHGAVVIAAITRCTNTSNPAVMIGAGLLAKKAVERGLRRKPWVKSSLAPGVEGRDGVLRASRAHAVPRGARLPHRRLRLHDVHRELRAAAGAISSAVAEGDLVVCAVLSGNRNFEARIHPEVKANYLASPPLVVAYALAGRMDVDLTDGAARAGRGRARRVPARTSGRRPRRSRT